MGPAFTAEKRHFEATAGPGRHSRIFIAAAMAALFAGLAILDIALPAGVGALAQLLYLFVISAASYGTFLVRERRRKKVLLDVDRQRLVVDEGRGGTFPLSGAALGPWRSADGVISGSVLHVAHGAQTYCVGGVDYRPGAGVREGAPPSEKIDASLSKEDFEALLAFTPFAFASADRGAPAVVRCPLLPNPESPRHTFMMVAPVFGILALAFLAVAGLGAIGLFKSRAGEFIGAALFVSLLVGGAVLTIVLERRRKPELELEIHHGELRLRNRKLGRVVATGRRGAIDLTRGMHRAGADGADRDYPMLVIRMPGGEELTLGVYDLRYGWRDAAPYLRAPHYMVGMPDWNALIEFLELEPLVVARDDLGI